MVSLVLGVTLFGETIRTGWWLVPEACGAAAIVVGVLILSRAVQNLIERPPGGTLSKSRPARSDQGRRTGDDSR